MAHLEERLRERTSLPSTAIPRLKKLISKKLRGELPPGEAHHVKLPGGGYAVIKNVNKRPILASFLSPDMIPPGTDLTNLTGVQRLRRAVKTAAATTFEEAADAQKPKEISAEELLSLKKDVDFKSPKLKQNPDSYYASRGSEYTRLKQVEAAWLPRSMHKLKKEGRAALAPIMRKANPVSPEDLYDPADLSPERLALLPGVKDIALGLSGRHPDYSRFTEASDPRVVALVQKLRELARER